MNTSSCRYRRKAFIEQLTLFNIDNYVNIDLLQLFFRENYIGKKNVCKTTALNFPTFTRSITFLYALPSAYVLQFLSAFLQYGSLQVCKNVGL